MRFCGTDMARTPDWYDRFPLILEQLENSSVETFGRKEIKNLFGCSERDSLRLLNRFGAARQGDRLQLDRTALLARLQEEKESPGYQAFCRQQGGLAQEMAVSREAAKARFRRIPGSVDFQAGRRLKDLPADITLAPGRLEVRFALEEDLWHLLDTLADFAAQDEESFRQRIEPATAVPARKRASR